MATPLTNQQKKEFARILYLENKELTLKDVAKRVGVQEKTVGNWAKEGNWKDLRLSFLTTKKDQLTRLYHILDGVTSAIEELDGIGNTKLADMMIKYTAAINNLETETSIAEIVESCRMALAFAQRNYPEYLKAITEVLDGFVQEKLK